MPAIKTTCAPVSARTGLITGQIGLKTMLQSIPGMRALWRGKDKHLTDQLAREWEELTGGGTDWLRLNTMFRNDDLSSAPSTMMANPTLARIEEKAFHAKRFVNAASGMAPINTFLQRITGRAIMNGFAQAALGKKTMPVHRLRALGLEDAMVERIYSLAGLPMTPEARARLESFMVEHRRGKFGQVIYDLERDFGIEPGELRKRFEFYLLRFPVRVEL